MYILIEPYSENIDPQNIFTSILAPKAIEARFESPTERLVHT